MTVRGEPIRGAEEIAFLVSRLRARAQALSALPSEAMTMEAEAERQHALLAVESLEFVETLVRRAEAESQRITDI